MLVFFTLVWGAIPIAFCYAVYKQYTKHGHGKGNKKRENYRRSYPEYKVIRRNVYREPATKKTCNVPKPVEKNYATGNADIQKYGLFGDGNSEILDRSVPKRVKLVTIFNKKFGLYLTESQIQTLVKVSYISDFWRVELEAMTLRYETVFEWLQGKTDWLRTYIYVFHVQEINVDLKQQEKICVHAFEQVFQYADFLGNIPMYEKVAKINSRFLTNFDDVTFMLAHRYLESKGYKHELKSQELVVNESEIDSLLEKYSTSKK